MSELRFLEEGHDPDVVERRQRDDFPTDLGEIAAVDLSGPQLARHRSPDHRVAEREAGPVEPRFLERHLGPLGLKLSFDQPDVLFTLPDDLVLRA